MTTPDRVLIERWQRHGDADARNALVDRYRGLVRALAARYADRGEPFDDLVQVAWIGLLKAIDRFDSSRDVQLTTYATPTIVGEIKRHYRDRSWAVHVPRSLQELRVRVHATIDRVTSEKGAAPTIKDIATRARRGGGGGARRAALRERPLGRVPAGERRRARRARAGRAGRGDRVRPLGRPDHARRGLQRLDERERRILHLRFDEGLTQSQIAAQLGISQMHVSRLLRRSLETLRQTVGDIDELD